MTYTFSIIKPDAVEKNHTDAILRRISNSGFRVIGIKNEVLSKEKAEKFYSIHKGKPFYKDLIEFMTSGKIVTLALSYNNVYDPTPAFEKYRDLIGDTDPKESKTGTIRNLYGTDIAKNAVHGADSSENAKSEILYFFPEFVNKLI